MSTQTMIDAQGLRKVFLTHKGEELCAVDGLSFSVARGEIYGLLGPNGAGKTTTLRMLAGLMRPTAGRLSMGGALGVDVAAHLFEPLLLKERIGFLTAQTGLYGRLTPREVLAYFGRLRGIPDEALRGEIEELIRVLDIQDFSERHCEGLSTGQMQRVQIARTLVGHPPVLILDEPTLGLDVLSNQLILKFIAEAGRRGHTIVLSTHYLDDVETICRRFGLLHKGRLLAEGTLAELRTEAGKRSLSAIFRELVERVDGPLTPEIAWPGTEAQVPPKSFGADEAQDPTPSSEPEGGA